MPICGNKEAKVKYMELKYCRCQYEQIWKAELNIQKQNTADVNMERQGKES